MKALSLAGNWKSRAYAGKKNKCSLRKHSWLLAHEQGIRGGASIYICKCLHKWEDEQTDKLLYGQEGRERRTLKKNR
jgi:hypothetical protein